MDDLIKEWTLINIEIEKKLDKLKELEQEKENILSEAQSSSNLVDIKNKMNESISKYNELLNEIKILKNKAIILKEQISK